MNIISELYFNSQRITKLNGKDISIINLNGVDYQFGKKSESGGEETEEINYELFIDQLDKYAEGEYRVQYRGDCADWTPATMDVNGTGLITDNGGILQKFPFNKIKPCLVYQGQIIGYLNKENYALFEDGTPADIENPDYEVMVEFPKIYYKIEEEWDGQTGRTGCTLANLTINISNKAKDGYVCYSHTRQGEVYDSIYVSAYENYMDDDGNILCCANIKAGNSNYSHNYILNNLNSLKGSQYGTFNYHIATMLQILSLLLFKEYCGLYTYGTGYKGSEMDLNDPGINNDKGMFYGLYTAGSHSSKLFGLENILGGANTIMDGFMTTEDLHFLIYDPTNPNCVINYNGENYKEFSPNVSSATGYLIRVSGNTQYGFLPVGGTQTYTYSKPFYSCTNSIKKPSAYVDAENSSNKPYMIYSFGGNWKVTYQSLFTYYSMYNMSDSSYNAERLVCYPNNKKS